MIITKAFIFAVAAIAPVFSLPLPASVYEPGIWWPTSNQEWSEHWATSTQASSASHPTLHNLNPNAHGGQSHPIPSQSLLPNSSPPSNTPPGHHGGGTAPSTHLVSHSNQHPNLPVGTTAPHVDSESQPQAGVHGPDVRTIHSANMKFLMVISEGLGLRNMLEDMSRMFTLARM